LQRIVTNLISNALRYTDSGSVLVACRHRGQLLRIDVLDSGRGIAPEHHAEIFREFFQQGAAQGLGLGLAIVSRLCELLGHRIEVRSAPGLGSRFSVYVPLTVPKPLALSAATSPDLLQGRKVLLLDDDPEVLALSTELLRSWRCEVVAVATLAPGDLGALGPLPDLVIADFHLQNEANGIDAIRALRRHYGQPNLPAFVVSADTQPGVAQQVSEAGLVLLRKPASPMALRAVMTRTLHGQPKTALGPSAGH
jgi:CheY-like chemotaxis protein